ncbi:MAG: PEGA domain-containing protein, partial [Nitrospirota bacterium]|nr:PEGA domain-containing protein [Nitrospirota bacterium]
MMPPSLLYASEISEKSPAATAAATGENKTVLLTEAAAVGALTVASEPSPAFVYLDGKETGSTPIAIKNITAGEHIITVTKEGFADSSQSIIIKPGGITEAYARLDHESLIVRITTAPEGADIFWDEMNKGTSPATIENVSKGRHKIRLSKEDHDEQVDIIEVTAPVTEKSYQLRPHTGGITVKTEPAGAEVRIDGKAVGKTPLSIGSLPVKSYSVKLVKKGYVEKEITVIVPRDKTVKLEETLLLADTQRPEIIFEPVSKLIRENKNLISAKVIENQAM